LSVDTLRSKFQFLFCLSRCT